MTTTLLIGVALAAVIVTCYVLMHNTNSARKLMKLQSAELLHRARVMFSMSASDVVKLDALYEVTFRKAQMMLRDGSLAEYERLLQESILIFNLKNQIISESVNAQHRRAATHVTVLHPEMKGA
jgi:hypothetical protein